MSEHYTKNTESVTRFCRTCDRLTQHAVSDGRIGRCKEHEAPKYSQAQLRRIEKAANAAMDEYHQPKLFWELYT